MPYKGQQAGKGGHSDIVRNPDVSDFLKKCQYIREPSDDEGKAVAGTFAVAPNGDAAWGFTTPAMYRGMVDAGGTTVRIYSEEEAR